MFCPTASGAGVPWAESAANLQGEFASSASENRSDRHTSLFEEKQSCQGNPLEKMFAWRNVLLVYKMQASGITSRMAMEDGLLVTNTEFPQVAATTIILTLIGMSAPGLLSSSYLQHVL